MPKVSSSNSSTIQIAIGRNDAYKIETRETTMSATIPPVVTLPERRQAARGVPCPRCFDRRFVTFGRMNEAQPRWAPAEAVLSCPDCAGTAQVIPFRHVKVS